MKASILYLIPLMLCYHVMSQEDSTPVPTPAPSSSPPTDSECPFVDFTCKPGLPTTTATFNQSEVCDPLFDPAVAGTGTLIFSGEQPVGFKCPNVYGLQTALLCFPPNLPKHDDYCFCDTSAYPRFRISEVHDIRFTQSASRVTEDEGTVTVCAVSGKLAEEFTPVAVTISSVPNTVKDGIDFVSLNKELSFSKSNQTHCVDVTILKDGVNEVDETLLLALTLKYPPFDVPLDTHTVTIIDSDIVGIGFEKAFYTKVVLEGAGSVSFCVVTNVSLNGSHHASGTVQTVDVTAKAGSDYLAAHEPIVFNINGGNRSCVDITIYDDRVMDEPLEVFLLKLTSTNTPVFADLAVVVILDNDDKLYPFGSEAGDDEVPVGIVLSRRTTSPPLLLAPPFRFFGKDEDTLYVNTNGVLSFKQPFREPNPQPLPFKSLTFISPYWEHFGTARFGHIYYRNTTDPALLKRVLHHLQDVFSSARDFSPSYLFLATWANVPQFGILSAGSTNLGNSFQVVMATNGEKSYVIFIYVDIKWGEGGMGFNAGDGVKSFTLPGSLTAAARDVEYGSNVDTDGVYAYRVDLPDIAGPDIAGPEVECGVDSKSSCKKQEVVQIGFEQTSYTVEERNKAVTVCASVIAGTPSVPVPVTLTTLDIASALAGKDYRGHMSNLIFDRTTQRACAEISIINDGVKEQDESFLVVLVTTQSNTVSLKPQSALVTILDSNSGDYFGVRVAIMLTIVCAAITFAYFKGSGQWVYTVHKHKVNWFMSEQQMMMMQVQRRPHPPGGINSQLMVTD